MQKTEAEDALARIVERAGLRDFHIACREDGWVAVRCRDVTRTYPLTQETEVLVSGDVRRGAFD